MNILPETSNVKVARGAFTSQASDRMEGKAATTSEEREISPADTFESSDPEPQVASYGKIIGQFGHFLGGLPVLAAGAAAGLAATLAVVGGMAAGPILLGAGLIQGSLPTAVLGLGIGGASFVASKGMEKLMDWIEKRNQGKTSPPSAKPSLPAPSDIPGAELTREAVLALASQKGSSVYERLASSYEHSAPIYGGYVRTYGNDYDGPTLGHMHARAGREVRKQQVEAADHLKRTHVGLGFGAVLAGAAVLSGGVVGVGLGGLSCLMLKGAYDTYQERESDLALAEAHASNQQRMEALGRRE